MVDYSAERNKLAEITFIVSIKNLIDEHIKRFSFFNKTNLTNIPYGAESLINKHWCTELSVDEHLLTFLYFFKS